MRTAAKTAVSMVASMTLALSARAARADESNPTPTAAEDEGSADGSGQPPAPSPSAPFRTRSTGASAPTASTSTLSRDRIEAAPRRTAEDALRQVPGVTLVQHGGEGKGQQLFVRGFDAVHGADFAVSLDGVPLNEWSNLHGHGYIDLALIIPETIREVSVTKGPFGPGAGLFATGASADFRLGLPGDQPEWQTSYSVGSTNRHRVVGIWTTDADTVQGFAATELLRDAGFGENREAQRASVTSQWRWSPDGADEQWTLTAAGSASEFGLPGALRASAVANGNRDAGDSEYPGRGSSSRLVLALRRSDNVASWSPETTLWVGLRALRLRENFTGDVVDPVHGDAREQRHGALDGGVRYAAHRDLDPLSMGFKAGVMGGRVAQAEVGLRESAADSVRYDVSGFQVDGWLEPWVSWRVTSALSARASSRFDAAVLRADDAADATPSPDLAETSAWSPRVEVTWAVTDQIRGFAASGFGVRPPELRAVVGREPLSSAEEDRLRGVAPAMTQTWTSEVGARWTTPRGGIQAAGFGTWVEHETIFDHVAGVSLLYNATRRVGAEWVAFVSPVPWLRLEVDATWTDARFVASRRRVAYAPAMVSAARAELRHEAWMGGMRLLSVADRALPLGATAADLWQLDAVAGWQRGRWAVRLEAENLLWSPTPEGQAFFASHWPDDAARSSIPAVQTFYAPGFNLRATVTLDW